MYIKKPMEIETKSMDIIEKKMKDVSFSEKEKIIVKRMIHTTGDTSYRKIVFFKNGFIDAAERALQSGITVFTDTKMTLSGINKTALAKTKNSFLCLIDDEAVFKTAKKNGITRSSAAVDMAAQKGAEAFVIGNAPTALFRLLELYEEGKIKPLFVVGVPVGFVGAAESKKSLRLTDIPQISTQGTKGGSTVAASVINALLYMYTGS
jgi:precorrin-8X methylmutase